MIKHNLLLEIVSKGIPTDNPEMRKLYGCEYVPIAQATYYLHSLCDRYNSLICLRPLDFTVVKSTDEMSMIVKFSGPCRKIKNAIMELLNSEEFADVFLVHLI